MTLDPVEVMHTLDAVGRHYEREWPAARERLGALRPRGADDGVPRVDVLDWAVSFVLAGLGLESSPALRRSALATLRPPAARDAAPTDVVEAHEEEEAYGEVRRRTVRAVAEQLRGQPSARELNVEFTGSDLARDLSSRHLAAWKRLAPSMVRTLEHRNVAALVAELHLARSVTEALDAARRRLFGLRWPARVRFLELAGFPLFLAEPHRMRVMTRLGWLDGARRHGRGSAAKDAEARQQDALRVVNQVAHTTGYGPGQVSLLLGLLAGRIPAARRAGAEGWCGPAPRCEPCPARATCLYARLTPPTAPAPADRLPIKHWAREDRPREKALEHGVGVLTDAELLAVLLRTGGGGQSALDLAQTLLGRFETLRAIDAASVSQLCEAVPGIGPAKAVELKAALEIGRRLASLKLSRGRIIRGSEDVYRALCLRYRAMKQEVFQMLALTTKNEVIQHVEISRGTLSSSLVHPRDVFKMALSLSASAVIFVHNHPSGDPTPSDADMDITRRLQESARVLGIRMHDHIILGHESYYSFTDGGVTHSPPGEWESAEEGE